MLMNVLKVLDKILEEQEMLLELYRKENVELKRENAELKAGIEKCISNCEAKAGE